MTLPGGYYFVTAPFIKISVSSAIKVILDLLCHMYMTRCVKITSASSCLETKCKCGCFYPLKTESELYHSLLLLQFGGQLCCD